MKRFILCVILMAVAVDNFGQLVRRVDYDAAFALQVGGETGFLTTFKEARLSVMPTAGLKMTFPFTRKWFLGAEVNYNRLKYGFSEDVKTHLDMKQVSLPLYVKYMLNCNRASVLFGLYGAYVYDGKLTAWTPDMQPTDLSENLETWNGGITVGYEHRIVKRLNVMCRVDMGVREVAKGWTGSERLLPVRACITLSYDIFRIGDCECD